MMTKQPTSKKAPSSDGRSLVLFASACGLNLFTLVVIMVSRGRILRLLEDFELPPPALSELTLSLGVPIALAILLLATVAVEASSLSGKAKNAVNRGAFYLGLGFLGLYALGVAYPLIKLMQQLS